MEGDLPTIEMSLWKSDMVTGVLDVDKAGQIGKAACCVMHSTGLVFGCGDRAMVKHHIHHFLHMPANSNTEWLLGDDKVGGGGGVYEGEDKVEGGLGV